MIASFNTNYNDYFANNYCLDSFYLNKLNREKLKLLLLINNILLPVELFHYIIYLTNTEIFNTILAKMGNGPHRISSLTTLNIFI